MHAPRWRYTFPLFSRELEVRVAGATFAASRAVDVGLVARRSSPHPVYPK